MGRCQSTPGLVESRGRVPLEEMVISSMDTRPTTRSLFSPSPSPRNPLRPALQRLEDAVQMPAAQAQQQQHQQQQHHQQQHQHRPSQSSPVSASSSRRSSEDATARAAAQLAAAGQLSTGRQSTHSGVSCNSMTQLVSEGTTPLYGHEPLLAEIKYLRNRLACLESENATMSEMLSKKQSEVESRLAEIEMQICGGSSTSSVEDIERNRESII